MTSTTQGDLTGRNSSRLVNSSWSRLILNSSTKVIWNLYSGSECYYLKLFCSAVFTPQHYQSTTRVKPKYPDSVCLPRQKPAADGKFVTPLHCRTWLIALSEEMGSTSPCVVATIYSSVMLKQYVRVGLKTGKATNRGYLPSQTFNHSTLTVLFAYNYRRIALLALNVWLTLALSSYLSTRELFA